MSINTLAHVFTPHGNIVYTANDFRQTVRIAVAGTIALSISTFYDVQYGVFFVVYPLMLMSLVRCSTCTSPASLYLARR